MGWWAPKHDHDWTWAKDSDDMVLSIIVPGQIFGWQICKCGQWRIRILEQQRSV